MYLTKMLTGKKVRLVSDVDSLDKYGRTLYNVYLDNGTFVNAELLKNGYAVLLKNGYAVLLTVPPNVAFADYFAKLQREARGKRKGLWRGGTAVISLPAVRQVISTSVPICRLSAGVFASPPAGRQGGTTKPAYRRQAISDKSSEIALLAQ